MRDNLYDIIDKLPSNKQLLFGISCVYRMETYLHKYFVNKEYMTMYDLIEMNVKARGTKVFDKEVADTISLDKEKHIEKYIPDTDDDGSCVAVLAQNAMIALSYCLNFINEEDVTAIEYCSKKMIETVDIYALSVLQQDSSDDLISQETAIQLRILNMIKNMNCHINENDINGYRKQLEQYKMT